MKLTRALILLCILLVSVLPAGSSVPAKAQVQNEYQVWKVPNPLGRGHTLEYRDMNGSVAASYFIALSGQDSGELAASKMFGGSMDAISIFDPGTGQVTYYPATGKNADTETDFYNLSAPIPSPDAARYVYCVSLFHNDQQPTNSWIYWADTGQGGGQLLFQLDSNDPYLYTMPLAWSADSRYLLFASQPMGIGGYILFWQYDGVQLYDLQPGTLTPVGKVDGYSDDLRLYAAVTFVENGPTGITVTDIFSGQVMNYPLPNVGEEIWAAGGAYFSPDGTKVAYQIARNDPMNEKFWTILLNLQTGTQTIILQDEDLDGVGAKYGQIGGWLDNNTLAVGQWTGVSAIIDVNTGAFLREERGSFVGYATTIANFAPSGDAFAQCLGAPTSRLLLTRPGRVTFTNGQPVNIRQSPGGEKTGTAPEGATFVVNDGPICQDGYAWWYLSFDDGSTYGWAAEGDAQQYYLEPLP